MGKLLEKLELRKHYSVLITDDDDAARLALQEALEPEYETYAAASGHEAIQIIERHVVHVSILDWHMPELSGLQTLQLIRQVLHQMIPVIFVTGEPSSYIQDEAMKANAYAVIPKPVNRGVMRFTVERALHKYYDA